MWIIWINQIDSRKGEGNVFEWVSIFKRKLFQNNR